MLNIQQGAVARDTRYTCLIYGEPGIGKTTFALGATKPLLLDCEDGCRRVEQRNLTMVAKATINSFNDLLQITNEDINPFQTIIIDTIGALITKAQEYIMTNKKKQTFAIQDWGTLKTYVLSIFEKFKNKNIIIIAHTAIEKVGDSERFTPLAQGSAIDVIETKCDLIGYMYRSKLGQRVIDFTGQVDAYLKNTFRFKPNIIIPNQNENMINNAFKKIIEDPISNYRKSEQAQAAIFNPLLDKFIAKIDNIQTPEHCSMILDEINDTQNILNLHEITKILLHNKSTKLGFKWDSCKAAFC